MGILEMVNSRYDTLSPVQKRIADFIFKFPDQVCFYSLKDLSETLGVTEVTVLRFTKKIGASSYVELKRLLREHLRSKMSGGDFLGVVSDHVGRQAETVRETDEMYQSFVENEKKVVAATYEKNSMESILEAVSLIKQSENVYVAGSELMTPVGSYLNRRLLTIGIRSVDLSSMTRALHNSYISQAGPEDLVILFCTPGYTRYIVDTARFLEKKKVPLLVITDRRSSPAAAFGTVVLLCDNHDLFFYNSILGYVSISNALVYFTAMDDLERTNRLRGKLSEAREAIGSVSMMRENL